MPDMLGYIFRTLEASEVAMRRQEKINRSVALFAFVVVASTVVQTKRIMALEKEIKELKRQREE